MTGRLLTVDHALDAWKIKERPGNNDEEASTAMITRHFQEKFIHLLDQAVVSFLAAFITIGSQKMDSVSWDLRTGS